MKTNVKLTSFFILMLCATCKLQAQKVSPGNIADALKGDIDAMYLLATEYKDANMIDSALYWGEKAAKKEDNAIAQYFVANIYEEMTPPNYEKAFLWYNKSAKNGYNYSQYRLGYFYAEGLGIKQNDKEAARWLKSASELGSCWGLPQYEYATRYAKGSEIKKWLWVSKDEGCKDAFYELGRRYYFGDDESFEENADSAFYFLDKSSNYGNADATYLLSLCYRYGKGCKQSFYTAMELYNLSKEEDSSLRSLSEVLENHPEFTNPLYFDEDSQQWSYKNDAADCLYIDLIYNNNDIAKYMLFLFYYTGLGVKEKDIDEAWNWLMEAEEADIFEAHYYLGRTYEAANNQSAAVEQFKKALQTKKSAGAFTSEEEKTKMTEYCKERIK